MENIAIEPFDKEKHKEHRLFIRQYCYSIWHISEKDIIKYLEPFWANEFNQRRLWVAVTPQNEFVGFTIYDDSATTEYDVIWKPWVVLLYVRPEFRGKGIAASLLRTVENHSKGAGHNYLYLDTNNASKLYKKLGWETIWRGNNLFDIHNEYEIMHKVLS